MGVRTIKPRVRIDGKSFRLDGDKLAVRGVTYGPFAPNDRGEYFASPGATARDFELIKELGSNAVRVFEVPPAWFLDLALHHGLLLFVDFAWNHKQNFIETWRQRRAARKTIRTAAKACADHPAVFAVAIANEIPPDLVRWCGADRIADFIDDAIDIVKGVSSGCLCTYCNYPSTEYLQPQGIDFLAYNVYLNDKDRLIRYLARLQMIAHEKPLILTELGMDSLRNGEASQAELLGDQIHSAFLGGIAGLFVYSFTDEWFKDGRQIDDWKFGLTTANRIRKPAFTAVQNRFKARRTVDLDAFPNVSVVVAAYNAARTLEACLESLEKLNYPDYEVIIVDDGSNDRSPRIIKSYPNFLSISHKENRGLSEARNTGIEAASGEVIAFTDADCIVDEDWLLQTVAGLSANGWVGVGGHNLLPPNDSPTAAAVMAAPGGPTHVMVSDREAEHVPGCNMAFYRSKLIEIGCFDPQFRRAGDDVDICWRLQQAGGTLGFCPGSFVWHHRRSTIGAYLKQQQGYGEAEALLARKFPELFNWLGDPIWRGQIYAPAGAALRNKRAGIYHGLYGMGLFQSIYSGKQQAAFTFLTSLEFHLLVTLPFFLLGSINPKFWILSGGSLAASLVRCWLAASRSRIVKAKRRLWSTPVLAAMFFFQPLVRNYSRYRTQWLLPGNRRGPDNLEVLSRRYSEPPPVLEYWAEAAVDRSEFLGEFHRRLSLQQWTIRPTSGWENYDSEIWGSRWFNIRLTTAEEHHPPGRRLFRCRFTPKRTVFAWATLGATAVFLSALIGGMYAKTPWALLGLILIPASCWAIGRQKIHVRGRLWQQLDETARDLGLCRINGGSNNERNSKGENKT